MKTYSEIEIFTQKDLQAFQHARQIVDMLPDLDSTGTLLRCHEVARVVGHFLALPVEDGIYELGAEHSWCMLPSQHILDVYAVGRIPPVQLVACVRTMPKRFTVKNIDLEVRTNVLQQLIRLVSTTLAKMDGQHERTGG